MNSPIAIQPQHAGHGGPPKVAILQKSDGILTWRHDLECGFHEAGALTRVISFRADTVAERWSQFRTKKRLALNPQTCRKVADGLAEFDPDLVVVLNFPGLPAEMSLSIRSALRPGTSVVGWLCDRLEVFPAICEPSFDGVYYFDSACLPVLENAYVHSGVKFNFLPLAACPRRYSNRSLPARERIQRLVFAGNCTPARQKFFQECQKLGLPVDLYGPHAGNFPRFWRNRKLSSHALAEVYQRYAVNLNLLQPGNTTHGLNMRAFEVPCAGGLATYPDVPDLARCFSPGKEILVYHHAKELVEMVQQVLSDPEFAQSVTDAGHRRVLAEHTFHHRAQRFLCDWLSVPMPS